MRGDLDERPPAPWAGGACGALSGSLGKAGALVRSLLCPWSLGPKPESAEVAPPFERGQGVRRQIVPERITGHADRVSAQGAPGAGRDNRQETGAPGPKSAPSDTPDADAVGGVGRSGPAAVAAYGRKMSEA